MSLGHTRLVVATLLCACSSSPARTAPSPLDGAASRADVAILTGGDQLLIAGRDDFEVRARVNLGPGVRHGETVVSSRRMGQRSDGSIVVLTARGELSIVAPGPWRQTARHQLPAGEYRHLSLARSRDRIAVAGTAGADLVVHVIDPRTGVIQASGGVKSSGALDWIPYHILWSRDESRLYVSYHGRTTSGIDWFDLDRDTLVRCVRRDNEADACIAGHGSMAQYENELVIATGSADIRITGLEGQPRGAVKTAVGGHLMEFAVDSASGQLVVLGPCGYSNGFGRIDLRDRSSFSETRVNRCSEQVTAVGSGLFVSVGHGGAEPIELIDGTTGLTRARLAAPQGVLDVLSIRSLPMEPTHTRNPFTDR